MCRLQSGLGKILVWRVLLLIPLLPLPLHCYDILEEVGAEIAGGDVKYYSIETADVLLIALISDTGDADMYASTTSKQPVASSEDSEFSSTSCGIDVMVIPAEAYTRRVSIGVYGHIRHESTSYRLYVIVPSRDEIMQYQVWDWDPETNREQLLIDIDPLVMSNDPRLYQLLEELAGGEGVQSGQRSTAYTTIKTVIEWAGYLIVKGLEIAIEILL